MRKSIYTNPGDDILIEYVNGQVTEVTNLSHKPLIYEELVCKVTYLESELDEVLFIKRDPYYLSSDIDFRRKYEATMKIGVYALLAMITCGILAYLNHLMSL